MTRGRVKTTARRPIQCFFFFFVKLCAEYFSLFFNRPLPPSLPPCICSLPCLSCVRCILSVPADACVIGRVSVGGTRAFTSVRSVCFEGVGRGST